MKMVRVTNKFDFRSDCTEEKKNWTRIVCETAKPNEWGSLSRMERQHVGRGIVTALKGRDGIKWSIKTDGDYTIKGKVDVDLGDLRSLAMGRGDRCPGPTTQIWFWLGLRDPWTR